jgi:hypothetical protein
MPQAYAPALTFDTKSALWLLRISPLESAIGWNLDNPGRLN